MGQDREEEGLPSWFGDTSAETLEREEQRRSQEWARKKQRRSWMPVKGRPYEGVLLDDNPHSFMEHNLYLNGTRKGNFFTCIARLDDRDDDRLRAYWGGCPLCNLLGDEPYMCGLVTILNLTPFEISSGKDKGKEIPMFRTMLTLRLAGLKWLNYERNLRKTLVGCKYSFRRDQKNDPVYGVPSFIEKVNINDRMFKYETKERKLLSPDPFDYRKVTAPLPYQRMLSLAEQAKQQKDSGGDRYDNDRGGSDRDEDRSRSYGNGRDDRGGGRGRDDRGGYDDRGRDSRRDSREDPGGPPPPEDDGGFDSQGGDDDEIPF